MDGVRLSRAGAAGRYPSDLCREVAAAAVSAGSPPGGEVRSPQSGLTVSEAVEQIKTELALDPSLDLVDAVSVAWEKLRLGDAAGLRLKPRVQTLCAELDIEVGW